MQKKELKVQLQQITGMGKPTRIPNLHLTLAVLNVQPGEIEEVCTNTQKALERFKDMLTSNERFMLTCSIAKFLDHGSFALGKDIEKEMCTMARNIIEEELSQNLADLR